MRVGFAGTRRGMSPNQYDVFSRLLRRLNPAELHHGDCVGSDAQAQWVASSLGIAVVVHPPTDGRLRAFCQGDTILETRSYLVRNRHIVDDTDLLIATPRLKTETGGTWYTVNYARKNKKRVYLITRDGVIKKYNSKGFRGSNETIMDSRGY